MKKIILIFLIHFFGLTGLFLFIIARIEGGHKILTHKNIPHYGDLYKINYINHFNAFITKDGKIYPRFYRTDKQSEINKADILIYGDSFFFLESHKTFPERLHDTLYKKIFFESINLYNFQNNPFLSFANNDFKPGNAQVLIMETGERGITFRFSHKLNTNPSKFTEEKHIFNKLRPGEANKRYTRILQTSFATHYMYSIVTTTQFNWFNYMPELTSRYSLNPPWLFNKLRLLNEKETYFDLYDDKEIENFCTNIESFKNDLKELYNIELLLIIVPEKITIYDKVLGWNDYSNFLPELYECLGNKDIDFIDLYHPFKETDKLIYHPTDTHWNENGIELTMDIFFEYLKNNPKYSFLLENINCNTD